MSALFVCLKILLVFLCALAVGGEDRCCLAAARIGVLERHSTVLLLRRLVVPLLEVTLRHRVDDRHQKVENHGDDEPLKEGGDPGARLVWKGAHTDVQIKINSKPSIRAQSSLTLVPTAALAP